MFYYLIGAAACWWFLIFNPWLKASNGFWGEMFIATAFLVAWSISDAKKEPPPLLGGSAWTFQEAFAFKLSHIWIGLIAAAVLYGVFFVGDRISSMLFDFAKPQVAGIYSTKTQASPWIIGALLFLWIGPAEEIFWRGYVQRRFSAQLGEWKGLIVATLIYALIHIWSFNFMLIMAALICGVFWALMYKYYKSVWPGIISHAVWDLVIFVLLPIQ